MYGAPVKYRDDGEEKDDETLLRPTQLDHGCFRNWLERKFKLSERDSTLAKEIRAGTATFLTMSYIVIVNSRVAGGRSGIPTSDVMLGTAVSSFVASFVCGYFGNLPFAIAPGLGLSAYISVGLARKPTLPLGHAHKHFEPQPPQWQTALAACAVAGFIQMIMARRLSNYLMKGTPRSVQVGTVVGMGLLIAFVALQQIGFVEKAPDVPVALRASNSTVNRDGGPLLELGQNAYSLESCLACFGLVVLSYLAHLEIPGSVLIAVAINTLFSISFLGTDPPSAVFGMPKPQDAFLAWDFQNLTLSHHLSVILSFVLVGVFDIAGVLIGLSHIIKLEVSEEGIPHGSSWAFFAAGLGTVVGAMFGSTPVIVHLESAAGLTEGGRTGITACVCSFWFLCCVFAAPLLDSVPPAATSPVLFFVGSLMMGQIESLHWKDPSQSIPAFVSLALIPFTFSVPNGVFFGAFISSVFAIFDTILNRCKRLCGK